MAEAVDAAGPPAQEESTAPVQVPRLQHEELCMLLRDAGLMDALKSYLGKHEKRLIASGLKVSNLRSMSGQAFVRKVLKDTPDRAYAMVTDWISKELAGELEEFAKQAASGEYGLEELLLSRTLHKLDLTDEPADLRKIARLNLACHLDPGVHGMARRLAKVRRIKSEAIEGDARKWFVRLDRAVREPASVLEIENGEAGPVLLLAACAVATRFQERAVAEKVVERVAEHPKLKAAGSLVQAVMRHATDVMPAGRIKAWKMPLAHPGEFARIDGLEVLAQCQKHEQGDYAHSKRPYAFSKVLAVKRPGSAEWKELDDAEAERLFPTRGSIMHFDGSRYPALPSFRSYAVWNVEEQATDASEATNLTHASAYIMPVHKVSSFEGLPSDDSAGIRDKILELSGHLRSPGEDTGIIHLADDIFIQPEHGFRAFIEAELAVPLRAWQRLDIVQMQSGLNLHVGELPDTSRIVDLSGDKRVVFKALEQLSVLDESQRAKYAALLEKLQLDPQLESLMAEMQLDGLAWNAEEVGKAVEALLAKPEVVHLVEQAIEAEVDSLTGGGEAVEDALETINAGIDEARRVMDSRRSELRNLDGEVDDLIERYFRKIVNYGRKVMEDPATRRRWFPELDSKVASFGERLARLEEDTAKLGDGQ